MGFAEAAVAVGVVMGILASGALAVVVGGLVFMGLAGLACWLDWLLLPDLDSRR